jgi:hypothetical protein
MPQIYQENSVRSPAPYLIMNIFFTDITTR